MKLSKLNINNEEHVFALKYSRKTKARDVFNTGEVVNMTFYTVKELQRLFNSDSLPELIKFILSLIKESDPDVFDFFAQYNYLREQIDSINEVEGRMLAYSPTAEEEAAGLERFSKFGYFPQIDSLAQGKPWRYEEVKRLPYETAFTKLLLDKEKSDFDKEMYKIMSRKN